MLKKIIELTNDELQAAEKYINTAFEKKSHCPTTADLFILLAGEEIAHAEKLMARGQSILSVKRLKESDEKTEMEVIWEWENEKATLKITALRIAISSFKSL